MSRKNRIYPIKGKKYNEFSKKKYIIKRYTIVNSMVKKWKNWGGNVQFKPENKYYPETEEEIVNLVKEAIINKKTIRVAGSGHSFTQVVETEMLLSLDKFQGIVSVDGNQVTVKSGTKLKLLGRLLHEQNLAMENLGDIDVQSIAGAISTGTHGTGYKLRTIATQISKIKFVNGKGEIITVTEQDNYDLFKSAQISLGMIGILLEITINALPSYVLAYRADKTTFDKIFGQLEDFKNNNRNFEFYWFPYSKYVQTKVSNISEPSEIKEKRVSRYFNDLIFENYIFQVTCTISKYLSFTAKYFSKLAGATISPIEKTNYSYKIYTTPRKVRFVEMEYSVPEDKCEEVLNRISEFIQKEKIRVNFPVEVRFVKSDDIFLSPAYESNRCYIAVHMYKGMKYQKYFEGAEKIFLEYNGRPHWGKKHFLTNDLVVQKYPKVPVFLEQRQNMDPEGIFLNDFLKKLFNL